MFDTFELVADPTRRRILDELLVGERPVGALVDRLDVSQPAVSKQLKLLRDAGLVTVRKEGRRRIYRLRAKGLRELDDWLAPFRVARASRMDALERTLDSMEG